MPNPLTACSTTIDRTSVVRPDFAAFSADAPARFIDPATSAVSSSPPATAWVRRIYPAPGDGRLQSPEPPARRTEVRPRGAD
jgi:hypothetical protein